MNSEGEESRDNNSSTGTAARKHGLDFDQENVPPAEDEKLEKLRASLVPLQPASAATVSHAPEVARDQDVDRSGEGTAHGASEATAAQTSEDPSTLASPLSEAATVHYYMAEALELITDDPHQKSRAIAIKRTEAAQIESFPPRTDVPEDISKIQTLVEDATRESLWDAFHTNPWLASVLLVEDVKAAPALHQNTELNLTFLLQEQTEVQLSMARQVLARLADERRQKIRAVEILLDEAEQHPDRETLFSVLQDLKCFEPSVVIPKLIAFLRKADDVTVRVAALETLEHLIHRGFAANASAAPAVTGSESVIPSVESPRAPIHSNLTVIPKPAQTAPVPRTDTAQQIPPGSTAAPPPDLDLATESLPPTVSGVQRGRTELVSGQESCENVKSPRQHLEAAAGSLAHLEPGDFERGELLKVVADLNVAFSNVVDRLLRPNIEEIEHSLNEQLRNRASATLKEKQELSKWANAQLEEQGLAIRCPKTGRPSTLVAGPGNKPTTDEGRFRLQHKGMDEKWKRPVSTSTLPHLHLMADLPALDVALASVLRRLAGPGSTSGTVA